MKIEQQNQILGCMNDVLNQNGFREYDLNYVDANVRDTLITVAVNGSSKLDRDVRVDLAVNPDTLEGYNWEKYRNDRSLYYELLPEECYSFNGEGIIIKAGTEYTDVPISFNLDKIDKDKNFVLPISIVSTSEYRIGEPKYSTILMNVVLSNAYTGTYSLGHDPGSRYGRFHRRPHDPYVARGRSLHRIALRRQYLRTRLQPGKLPDEHDRKRGFHADLYAAASRHH